MPQNSVVTEQGNILHKNRNTVLLQVEKLFWLSTPKLHTGNMTEKSGSFWLRQLNKSGCFVLFFFSSTQLKGSIRLDAAWGSRMHHRSLGFVLHVSPQQYPHFMHFQCSSMTFFSFSETLSVRSEWCRGARGTREPNILFARACHCPEGSVQKGAS